VLRSIQQKCGVTNIATTRSTDRLNNRVVLTVCVTVRKRDADNRNQHAAKDEALAANDEALAAKDAELAEVREGERKHVWSVCYFEVCHGLGCRFGGLRT